MNTKITIFSDQKDTFVFGLLYSEDHISSIAQSFLESGTSYCAKELHFNYVNWICRYYMNPAWGFYLNSRFASHCTQGQTCVWIWIFFMSYCTSKYTIYLVRWKGNMFPYFSFFPMFYVSCIILGKCFSLSADNSHFTTCNRELVRPQVSCRGLLLFSWKVCPSCWPNGVWLHWNQRQPSLSWYSHDQSHY